MEDDLIAAWRVDSDTGMRVHQQVFDDMMEALKKVADHPRRGHDDLIDVAMAGLSYARALTRGDSFGEARASKAYSRLSGAVMRCAHDRE